MAADRAAAEAPGALLDEERLAGLAAALADQFASLYDARPADPHAGMAGNLLTFAFQGGLLPADEGLLSAGHEAELKRFRERFMEVVGAQLGATVRTLAGAEVTSFSVAFDPGSRTTNMLFVVDLLPDDEEEQRAAIRHWSEQVRRNARELRMSHLQTRETHRALREQMEEARRRHEEGRHRPAGGRSEDA